MCDYLLENISQLRFCRDAHILHKDNNYFCGIKYIVFKSVKVIVEYEDIM